MKFRHEWKHEITPLDVLELRMRLRAVMKYDSHAIDGEYKIRSLYFDDIHDSALKEKINGVNVREKFRLRYYGDDVSHVVLEKKSKHNGLCAKEQELITVQEVKAILYGKSSHFLQDERGLVRELAIKMRDQGLQVKTIVDYTREPFIYAPGNVRVTIDKNIRTGLSNLDFLNPHSTTIPIKGENIVLEVKWDEFLPNVIRDIVQLTGRRTAAFSKYAACRMYD